MTLQDEIQAARTEIAPDGYEMSVGEIINLYANKEIIITPDFQRLFRWDSSRKTRFVESLLLGIPIPPIFVYQNEDGVWELIDGLQRLSTIFEFVGILRYPDESVTAEPSVLAGTRFLPGLANRRWEDSSPGAGDGIGRAQQLQIKRARLRVEILKQESNTQAKYELFQRLNTGGAELSEQEVRNCIAVMVNKPLHEWLLRCASLSNFLVTIDQTESALRQQSATELALRFFAFRNVPYKAGLDVHEYLDDALIKIAESNSFNMSSEQSVFEDTFQILSRSLGDQAFKRWDGANFGGKFLMSVYEVIATGVSKNLSAILSLSSPQQDEFVITKAKELWSDHTFQRNSGAGIRGTTRLANLLPMAESFMRP
jgi:hypothetical protein